MASHNNKSTLNILDVIYKLLSSSRVEMGTQSFDKIRIKFFLCKTILQLLTICGTVILWSEKVLNCPCPRFSIIIHFRTRLRHLIIGQPFLYTYRRFIAALLLLLSIHHLVFVTASCGPRKMPLMLIYPLQYYR